MPNSLNPYTPDFSEVYNLFWKDFIEKLGPKIYHLIQSKDVQLGKYLDLCCGTGRLIKYFSSKNVKSWGIDNSENMLALSQNRLLNEIQENMVTLVLQDVTQFHLSHKFDLITSTFDSINHLDKLEDVHNCFERVKRHLHPEGYFLFDINTEKTLKNWNFFEVEESEDKSVIYFMQGKYENAWNKAYSRVSGFIKEKNSELYRRFDEIYYNTIYSLSEITNLLKELQFKEIEFYNENLKHVVNNPEKEDRIFILAKA